VASKKAVGPTLEGPRKSGFPDGIYLPVNPKTHQPEPWSEAAKAYWNALRHSPQAALMTTEMDWQSARMLTMAVDRAWKTGSWEQLAEIRQREAKFGFTPEDRLRLHVDASVPEDKPQGQAPVSSNVLEASERFARIADA
jgi:hypothetical protein